MMGNEMMDDLIAVLGTKLELTAEDIADVFWLTHLQQQSFEAGDETEPHDSDDRSDRESGSRETSPNDTSSSDTGSSNLVSDSTAATSGGVNQSRQSAPEVGVVARQPHSQPAAQANNQSIKVPNAPSIRDPLALMKALRPLICRVPSGINVVLDEAATATKIAEEKIWIPATKPVLELWLELALVVDESTSKIKIST